MKMVEFTRDMAPIPKGAKRVLPDAVAAALVADGAARPVASFFDPPASPAPPSPSAAAAKRRYRTRST